MDVQYKCGACGWIHFAAPPEDAQRWTDASNTELARLGMEPAATADRYMRCCRCGASSAGFVPAEPGEVPIGATLQPIVLPAKNEQQK